MMRWTLSLASVVATACGDNTPPPPRPEPASVEVPLEVPDYAASAPLDVPRTMLVPPGFGIRVIARTANARFLAETPENDLLVSRPGVGQIVLVSGIGGTPTVTEIATGLWAPHDLVFTRRDGTEYLYIGEHERISRATWTNGVLGPIEPVIENLPSSSLPELMGYYGHGLKNIAIAGDRLYVSIASATNADPSDILADPIRGAIYLYDLDGDNGRLYAKGLRNAEGLALHPRTGDLWVVVNHRDNVRYPLDDGRFPYGAAVVEYINDNPPEPFTRVRDGGNYGWPYCNPTADKTNDDMPYYPDLDNNENEAVLDCDSIDPISKGLPAHSAPLGLSFWTGPQAPELYRNGALVGMHGCWNCSEPRGYKVAFLPLRYDNGFDDPIDLVTGFLTDPGDTTSVWGRPVDVIPSRTGNLYISDDLAGAVYELYQK